MQWNAIGAIAEVLGAIAVIVSIVYLAAQVRQTRLQLQAQAEDAITARCFDAYLMLVVHYIFISFCFRIVPS